MSGSNVVPFVGFVILAALGSPLIVERSNFLVSKITTYHTTEPLADPDEDYEEWFQKGFKVWMFYIVVTLTVTLLMVIYTYFSMNTNLGFTANTIFAFAMVSLVLVFSVRVVSNADIDTLQSGQLHNRLSSFAVSFIVTTWFLVLFGIGNFLIQNGIANPPFDVVDASYPALVYVLAIPGAPLVATGLSELILSPYGFGVRDPDPVDDD